MTYPEMLQIMDLLYTYRAKNLPPAALADVFDRLIWCLEDDGILLRAREEWLMSDEKGKVEIALSMNETYPFKSMHDMEMNLSRIASKWPEFAERCAALIDQRRTRVGE